MRLRLSRVLVLVTGLALNGPVPAGDRGTTVVVHMHPSVENDLRDEYFIGMLRLIMSAC